jgi:hypothetical protein
VSRSVTDGDPNADGMLSYWIAKSVSIAHHIFKLISVGRRSTARIGESPIQVFRCETNSPFDSVEPLYFRRI